MSVHFMLTQNQTRAVRPAANNVQRAIVSWGTSLPSLSFPQRFGLTTHRPLTESTSPKQAASYSKSNCTRKRPLGSRVVTPRGNPETSPARILLVTDELSFRPTAGTTDHARVAASDCQWGGIRPGRPQSSICNNGAFTRPKPSNRTGTMKSSTYSVKIAYTPKETRQLLGATGATSSLANITLMCQNGSNRVLPKHLM